MKVLDASALLAYLKGEDGSEAVREVLLHGAACSAANWSEVAQKIAQSGADWPTARALLRSFDVRIEAVLEADAEAAAAAWRAGSGLSLADRLCLALGARLGARVITADHEWTGIDGVDLIR